MLYIAIWSGGMLGAWLRYRIAGWIYARRGTAFPWGTMGVNFSGSFVLGILVSFLEHSAPSTSLRAFVTVGVLSSYTTFSTFAYEAAMLIREGERARAALYVGASVGLGLLAIAAGLALGTRFN